MGKKGEEKMLSILKKKQKKDKKFVDNIAKLSDKQLKELKINIHVDPAVKEPFRHFRTRHTQRRGEVKEFLTEMRDKYKLIHWEFEALGGGQYFIVAEVDKKINPGGEPGWVTPKR